MEEKEIRSDINVGWNTLPNFLLKQSLNVVLWQPHHTTPRHGDVEDRAEEEEHGELGKAALHGNILRPSFPSPAAFGTTGGNVTAQVIMLLG